jgi:predicted permease
MSFTLRIYRRLARAFPHEFKLAYGPEVLQLGEDVVDNIAHRRGATGLIRLIADIAMRIPLEYLSEMRQDMGYGLRALRKSPGFALAGILSMGLGMGAATFVYTSEWQSIFRELPGAANARRLAMPEKPVSYYYVEQYREQKKLFTGVAAFENGVPFNVNFANDLNAKPQRVFGQLVSADYFSVLGVQAQRGRVLSPDVDKPGNAPVVVISDRFWRDRMNSSPNAVGETLRLNGQSATIVGITPGDFNGAIGDNLAELFVPITAPAALAPELANDVLHQRDAKDFRAMMCLAPGVTLESAEAALDTITRHLEEQDASVAVRADKGRRVTLLAAGAMTPLPRKLKAVVAGFFGVLMGLIITIACMNLANMLLARGANRRKELAIRLSVGASRFRLVRQMISEGILLSMLGGVAGFALAYGVSIVSSRFTPPTAVPVAPDQTPDWQVAILVFGLAIVCGIGFSLAPALRTTKADLTPALREGVAMQLPGFRRFSLRNLLMVAQVTGSLMLLMMTGFLVLGLSQASSIQTRFDPHTMVLVSLDPVRDGYSPERAQALFERLPERLKTAGMQGIALTAQPPFSLEGQSIQVTAENSNGSSPVQQSVDKETIGAGYFAALNEPMLAGREFVDQDQRIQTEAAKTLPVVLNETAARRLFAAADAIGRRLRDDKQSYEVAGVARDLKNGLGVSRPVMYVPLTPRNFARPPAGGMTIMARSDAGVDALSGIRREIAAIDPNLNIFEARTLNDYLELTRSVERFAVSAYGGIGVFGLLLSAIGLAGVTAYAVAQRRKEIGIRMALGATKGRVLALVLREGTALVGTGTLLGFLGAYALAKMLSAVTNIFVESLKIGTDDPRLLLGAPLLLATLAMLACYVPARRAAKIDPLRAVREE